MKEDKKIHIYMTPRALIISVLLTITFVLLKLNNIITWSWMWVLSPLWIVQSILTILLIIIYVISLVIK